MAFFDAMASVEKEDAEVPNHLRDGNRDAEGFGHGQGYIYPHSYREHWAAQQYLPDPLVGRVFYTPSVQGYEGSIRDEVLSRRELQVAGILENQANGPDTSGGAYDRHFFGAEGKSPTHEAPRGEILTFSPDGKRRDEWTRRADSGRSKTLLEIREAITGLARISRHHRVLVFGADDGLLVWEAGRLAPEGLTVGLCRTPEAKKVLDQYALTLDELDRPILLPMDERNPMAFPEAEAPFDRVIARDPASTLGGLGDFAKAASERLAPNGSITFSARCPALGMRLSRLCSTAPLAQEAGSAEDALYGSGQPPFDWTGETLGAALQRALGSRGFSVSVETRTFRERRRIFDSDLEKWIDPGDSAYGAALAAVLSPDRLGEFRREVANAARYGPVEWEYGLIVCSLAR